MNGLRRTIGWLLLLAALVQFGMRGTQRVRREVPLWDFASVYAATRTWLHGGNPYDVETVIETWRHSTRFFGVRDVSYFATVYPPTSLLFLTPLALLPAEGAMVLWLMLSIALLAMQMIALARLAAIPWNDPRVLIFLGASLFSAPLQFAVVSGQLSLPAISLSVIALALARGDRQTLAGMLLGIACALKPQVGGPFVLYYVLTRRWRTAGWSVAVGGTIGVIAIGAMWMSHVNWIDGWRTSVARTTVTGGVNDYGFTAIFRDEIIDLRMLLIGIVHNPFAQRPIVAVISAALVLWWYRSTRRQYVSGRRDELLAAGAWAGVALICVYHRVYDAALLTTLLAWAVAQLDGPRRRSALVLLVPLAIFLFPFDTMLPLARRVPGLASLASTSWWHAVIEPHYAWGLLCATVVSLSVLARRQPASDIAVSA